jgi:CTP:molybdopterin cytidylyltransferase MocA
MSIAAIVLAAGASHRLGQPKQLLLLDGEMLLERALRLAKEAGTAPVLAVVGAHRETICASIQFRDATLVMNNDWADGISTSIHAGLRALEDNAVQVSGALVMGCDQPRLTSEYLRSLIAAFAARDEAAIIASSYAGIQGIPAIFPPTVFNNLLALRGDRGARALLIDPPCPVVTLPFDGGDVDIDLPADLDQLK